MDAKTVLSLKDNMMQRSELKVGGFYRNAAGNKIEVTALDRTYVYWRSPWTPERGCNSIELALGTWELAQSGVAAVNHEVQHNYPSKYVRRILKRTAIGAMLFAAMFFGLRYLMLESYKAGVKHVMQYQQQQTPHPKPGGSNTA